MKTKILNLAAIMLFLIGSSSSCEKENLTTLPPETQTGANTFGCYVNDELFVNDGTKPFGQPTDLSAGYLRARKMLIIASYSYSGDVMRLELNLPQVNVNVPISMAYYRPLYNSFCPFFAVKDKGEVILTKFDTVNCIASGRFNFPGQCASYLLQDTIIYSTTDSIVYVKDGRFDVKFGISQ
jgi:hypothetical protein